ncbi:hypothetical protein PoB_002570000 [Plakobranchus ocellatus]|uniref:Uncharacterized protein n=1 Tax=Plakobranchus ocellatus TaxID=259542 RepID=A0AAV3ZVH4_9GAST|nr:hypothetical protein PoB_002570000 [Plakobranchus ocellatus]
MAHDALSRSELMLHRPLGKVLMIFRASTLNTEPPAPPEHLCLYSFHLDNLNFAVAVAASDLHKSFWRGLEAQPPPALDGGLKA